MLMDFGALMGLLVLSCEFAICVLFLLLFLLFFESHFMVGCFVKFEFLWICFLDWFLL